MSGDSEIPKLKPQESENTLPDNSGESGKSLKRNYCYVCKVQCTALKNFLEHQKGRKHLKKLESKEATVKKSRQKQSKITQSKNNPTKRNLRSSQSLKPHEQNSEESELPEVNNTPSDVSNSADKSMNNSMRQTPKYKKNHCNSNNQNNYSRHQNSRYSYSNHYEENQEYYYNERPKPAYSAWRALHYPNAPPVHSYYNNYEFTSGGEYYAGSRYNAPFQNGYYSGNRNDSFTSHGYVNQGSHLPFTPGEPENSVYNFLRNEICGDQQLGMNSVSSGSADKSSSKDKSNTVSASVTINSEQGSLNNLNPSPASTIEFVEADKDVSSSLTISQISDSSNLKDGEKKRLRTRSLSSSESFSNGKRLKDKNESLSVDSDGTPEEQKLKEYTTSLLETNPNRISLMIQHPSSHKEKAVLNHIMTSFSKTKRKESLTRKLRSNSLGSTGNNDDGTLDVQSVSSENEEISVIMPSDVTSAQANADSDLSMCPPAVRKDGNNAEEYILDPMINSKISKNTKSPQVVSDNQNSKKSSKVNGKSKESSSLASRRKAPETRKEKSSESVSKKSGKRKTSVDDTNNKGKKQKFRDGRNHEIPCMSRMTELKDLTKEITPVVSSLNQPSSIQINPVSLHETAPVKEEIRDCADMNQAASLKQIPEVAQNQILDFNSQISVETLIELFASGDVTVKREYNDPVIDAIRRVDPNELINACSNDSHLNNTAETTHRTAESNVKSSKSTASVGNFTFQENANCINPVILGSTVDRDNITPVSVVQRNKSIAPNTSSTEKSNPESSLSMPGASEKGSLSEIETLNLISRTKSEFPHLITLIEELQDIGSQEDALKGNIMEAKLKINEFTCLLDEWKHRKKKLHDEEEELRKKRNNIIHAMKNAVKIHDTSCQEPKTEFLPDAHSTPAKGQVEQQHADKSTEMVQADKSTEMSSSSISPTSVEARAKKKKSNCSDCDEILILPSPVKPKPPEIIIVDDTDEICTEIRNNRNSLAAGEITPNFPNQGSSLYDTKNLTAHSTVINCIVVFDDYVYTCSNDNSAKGFSLKDTSQIITYLHTAKNVTEIAVEKVQNEALVFTSCSNRVLSLFIASNGTKIKTFFQSSNIKSICKGWGKFYAGMEDGTVNVYNWKYEEREFVKTPNPACRIATVHQGGLHILIILTTDGHVSLRDAKTSLLIRFIKTTVKFPAWLTVHNDFVCLSSSDRTVSVLDIQSGRIERKMQLGFNHATGLAVCDDYIFTISYSGTICCVNKDKLSDVTLFYGAGKTGLTCIHVHQNWVFTGNRKGDISVFRFDPCSRFSCKIGKCRSVYGSKEDLAFHFELQHLKKKNLALCQWEKCPFIFPVNYSTNDKINHLKKHIVPVPRGCAL